MFEPSVINMFPSMARGIFKVPACGDPDNSVSGIHFLAHLSRRLMGELIVLVTPVSVRRPSVHIFKYLHR